MSVPKPTIPKGTRDFSPEQLEKRSFIFDTIRKVFIRYGFQPIETPTMENLSTLTGKYGEEGDQLLFKVLNSGDFLRGAKDTDNYKKLTFQISEKGLRYDLTIPFARYVVMHQNEITFPFKRYQIQPVWRGDAPQHGRYREFYQCDVDIVGSNSLVNEAELVQIYDEVFTALGIPVVIKINNRKILQGLAEVLQLQDKIVDITVAIDKLDKIGEEGVQKELESKGIPAAAFDTIRRFFAADLQVLDTFFADAPAGKKGVEELRQVFSLLKEVNLSNQLQVDLTLARGLNYYTGCIFEVKTDTSKPEAAEVKMGSIGGGGRYDDLTGMFGLKGVSGVGVSFGAERIYDVMEAMNLFPQTNQFRTQVLFIAFDEAAQVYALPLLRQVRTAGINAEIYPDLAKMKKQFDYANKRNIPYVVVIGSEEMQSGLLGFKNMQTGGQEKISIEQIVERLKAAAE